MLELFVGGNCQGHNDLAMKAYNGIIADGKEHSIESIENADIIINYHEFVRKLIEMGKDPLEFSENINAKLLPVMKLAVVLCLWTKSRFCIEKL